MTSNRSSYKIFMGTCEEAKLEIFACVSSLLNILTSSPCRVSGDASWVCRWRRAGSPGQMAASSQDDT